MWLNKWPQWLTRLSLQLSAAWYQPPSFLTYLLWPLAIIYAGVMRLRYIAYQRGILRRQRLPVPVIAIGNITVGGTGKTALVMYLAQALQQAGHFPGILSRGYQGNYDGKPLAVTAQSDPRLCGDEPVLIAQKTGLPVFIAHSRIAAGQALLASFPGCNVLLLDDGMQHLALYQDVVLCIIDSDRQFGNGYCLPAGPLREPLAHLPQQFLVWQRSGDNSNSNTGYHMFYQLTDVYALTAPKQRLTYQQLQNKPCELVIAVANPSRLLQSLQAKRLVIRPHLYPDHYAFTPEDFKTYPADAVLLMTEKDAVKCQSWADARFWVIPTLLHVDDRLLRDLLMVLSNTATESSKVRRR